VEVLRNAGSSRAVLSVWHVGSLTIVPLVGNGITDDRGEIEGVHISSGTVSGKVLSISTATLGHVVSEDAALGNGLSIASKSGVPDQSISGVVSTVLVVVEESSRLVVSWLSIGSSLSSGNLDDWGGLNNWGGSLSCGFRSWSNGSWLWLGNWDDSRGWGRWWWRRGRGRWLWRRRGLRLVVSKDGVLDDDGGVGGDCREWLTSSHGNVHDISDDVGNVGLLVHSLVLNWRGNGDGSTEDSEDS